MPTHAQLRTIKYDIRLLEVGSDVRGSANPPIRRWSREARPISVVYGEEI